MADVNNIEIGTKLETRGVKRALQDLAHGIKGAFAKKDVAALNAELENTKTELQSATKSAKEYKAILERINAGKIVSTDQAEIQSAIKATEKELANEQKAYDKLASKSEIYAQSKSALTNELKEQEALIERQIAMQTQTPESLGSYKSAQYKMLTTQERLTELQEEYEQSVAETARLWKQAMANSGRNASGHYNEAGEFVASSVAVQNAQGQTRYISANEARVIAESQQHAQELATAITTAKQQYAELAQYIENVSADIKVSEEFKELDVSIEEANRNIEIFQKNLETYAPANDHIRELEAEITRLKTLLEHSKATLLQEAEQRAREAETRITELTEKVAELEAELNGGGTGGGGGGVGGTTRGIFGRMFGSMQRLDHMFKRMTMRLLFYNTFGKAIRSFAEYLGRAVKADSNLVQSLGALKAAFATTFQYIWSIVSPILSKIIAIILNLVNAINRLLGLLTGKSLGDMQKGAKALAGYGTAAKGATKEIKKTLAAFDELIQIGDKDEDKGSGGAGDGGGIPLNWDDNLLRGKLSDLDIYVAGAMLAVGAILTFSGANVPLGLALMAAGAAVIVSALKEDWDSMPKEVKTALTRVLVVLGTAALVIGAILVFSGAHIALGIGLMIAGAAALGTAAKLNWGSIETALKGPVGALLAVLLTALLVIGAILTFSGANIFLGIGLMIAGAAGLAAIVNLNWNTMSDTLSRPILAILAILSTFMVVVGMVLALSGANLFLGIGLIAAGAVILGKAVAPRWDTMKTMLQGPLGVIMTLLGTFLVVLGVILLLSGAGIPLGLGLLATGAVSLAAPIAANWDIIREKVKYAWEAIKQYWNTNIKPVFTITWWKSKFKTISDALKSVLNTAISAVESALNWMGSAISDVLSVDIPNVPGLPGAGKHFGLTIPKIHLPRLAQGAVIPPNKEFMAMLGDQRHGTNIEAPLDTMVQAFTEALDSRGGQNITIKFDGSLAQLARVLKPYIEDDDVRQGRRSSNGLIVGGSY